jgi:hypothetical protein
MTSKEKAFLTQYAMEFIGIKKNVSLPVVNWKLMKLSTGMKGKNYFLKAYFPSGNIRRYIFSEKGDLISETIS